MSELVTEQAKTISAKAGKYLVFELAGEQYGLEIAKVRELIGMMDITSVPRMPKFILGVINLRGRLIAVIDLRRKLAMPETARTNQTCIIVVNAKGVEIGIVVDKVLEVLNITADCLAETPCFGKTVNTEFVLGMAKTGQSVRILLDVERLLTQEEMAPLQEAGKPIGR